MAGASRNNRATIRERITSAFRFIFQDDDWFNKVLLGGFFLLFTCIGIGYIFVVGYQVETVKRILRQNETLPEWKKIAPIVKSGTIITGVDCLYALAAFGILSMLVPSPSAIVLVLVGLGMFYCIFPLIVLRYATTQSLRECFNLYRIAGIVKDVPLLYLLVTIVSFTALLLTVLFGWMWIIVGWPLLIFLAILVQSHLLSQLAQKPPGSYGITSPATAVSASPIRRV